MTKLLFGLGVLFFSFVAVTTPPITGRWKVHDPRGPEFIINFKTDHTFTAYSGAGKVLITGNYRCEKDTFLVNDNNCNGDYWGKYNMHFYGSDSMTFKVLADTCTGRAEGVNGITMARLLQK
jgi:hypothetical protein